MRLALKLHPDSRCDALNRIEVEVARPRPNALKLRYFVTGAIDDLRMPAASAPARADGIWQHSCFEAFVRAPASPAYCEFNFSPSTQWAAYRFGDYRSGMEVATEIAPPRIETRSSDDCYEMQVSLELDRLNDAVWQLALSAVIEETNGRKSYWALAHPPGKADFHHPESFACELP